jgi:hypothetical protein
MINLAEVVKGVQERVIAKIVFKQMAKDYERMAALFPRDFENLGYTLIRGEIKTSHCFGRNKVEYEIFKGVWEERYNGRLPDFS